MNLADRIKAAMAASGVTQAELARACGVKPPSVNGWLGGKAKFLRGENLLKAARALNVNQDWLATGKLEMRRLPNGGEGSGLAGSLRLTIETAAELRLITVYRLANEHGRGAIDDIVDIVQSRLDTAVRQA